MRLATFNQFLLSLSCVSLLLGVSLFNHDGAIAQPEQSSAEKFRARILAKKTKLTGRQKARGSRSDGSQENVCGIIEPTQPGLTAIVPAIEKPKGERGSHTHHTLSVTTSAKPTLWFYLPYQIERSRSAEFRLKMDGKILSAKVNLPKQPGLYPLPFPFKDVELNPGKAYSWNFLVTCVSGDSPALDDVEGMIERIEEKEVSPKLNMAKTVQQKFEVYANQGIWHESLEILTGEMCQKNPKLAQQRFNDLMREIDLAELVEKTPQPLLAQCYPSSGL